MTEPLSTARLADYLADARARTLELVRGLDAAQLMGPRLDIVNPLLWEIGHVGWFHEYFALRRLGWRSPRLPDADAMYNSSIVPHASRWELPLPSLPGHTRLHGARARRDAAVGSAAHSRGRGDRTLSADDLPRGHARRGLHLFASDARLSGTGIRRRTEPAAPTTSTRDRCLAMSRYPVGVPLLGSPPESPFVFDNEKWAHPVEVAPFNIARAPVTNAEFLAFVTEGGYRRREFWSE